MDDLPRAMPRALVTGASGLVGAHVVQALRAAGVAVRAGVRRSRGRHVAAAPGVDVVPLELAEPATLADACAGVDLVVHCAALLHGARDELERTNHAGTAALLDAAASTGVRHFVHVSSCAVYRDGPLVRAAESAPRGGGSDYARSKQAAEERVLAAAGRLAVAVLRPVTVYGPGDRWFLPLVARVVREHALPDRIGDGARLGLVHAADLADAIVAVAACAGDRPRCLNVAGEEVAAGDVLAITARATSAELVRFAWPEPLRECGGPEPAAWRAAAAPTGREPLPWSLVPALVTERTLDDRSLRGATGWRPRRGFAASHAPCSAASSPEAPCRS